MPVRIDCPRCQCRLSVADRKAGNYAHCPRCGTRLWIPAEAGKETPGTAEFPARLRSTALAAATHGNGKLARTARFISAEAASATLTLAGDGALPELHLRESATAFSGKTGAGNNPLITIGLPALSAVATIVILLIPSNSEQSSRGMTSDWARAEIEKEYFAEPDGLPHDPYQFCLREAQRAHLRGDYGQERELYRQVLDMLRAERKPQRGLTGSPGRDQALQQHLITLLKN